MSERVRNLVALSATHRTAGLDERAAFTVPAGGAEAFYAAAREAGLAEAVLLATCNRLEAYGVGDEAAALHVRSALIKATGASPAVLDQHLRPVPGLEAVEHLFAVVSGLESQMVGEVEIAGQVKDAYADALARGMTGPVLNRVFQRAFQAGAWARTHTGISQGQVSLGNVAVELAQRVFGSLDEARVLVLGTGDVGRQVVQALVSRGASQVSVASRTFENARVLAEEFAGSSLTLADALRQAHAHDVIVGCATVERALPAAKAGPSCSSTSACRATSTSRPVRSKAPISATSTISRPSPTPTSRPGSPKSTAPARPSPRRRRAPGAPPTIKPPRKPEP